MKKIILIILFLSFNGYAQEVNVKESLAGFEKYMSEVLADWNEPGAGVAVIYENKIVYMKGFGYRDYGNKLPVTKNTLFQIASNTKLFTTVAAGKLVEEGIFDWDKPITEAVPELEFYNDHLNNQITLRDMLGHKTGISRHDMIWFQSDFTRKDLFERMKYLEPSIPLRQGFIYNNLMYSAIGYAIELRTGKTWEEYIREELLDPLEMRNTVFSIKEMQKSNDFGVPYNEKRDSTILYKIPLKEDGAAIGPAGSIISNLEELSHWVIALLNDGKYNSKEVISPSIIKETLKPGMGFRNSELEEKGYKERLNVMYGMARQMEVYRGNILTKHGGAMPGFHSQIAVLPYDKIGIITFVIGDQGANLSNIIMYNLVDRLLGLEEIDWNGRRLERHRKRKEASKKGRNLAGYDHITGTSPTHPLKDYIGYFTNEAYGEFIIKHKKEGLYFNFRKTELPLTHYHFNRFDTPNDEDFGKWSLNFNISPQGEINSAIISIDEGQVIFNKKTDVSLSNPDLLVQYAGKYQYAGSEFEIKIKDGKLALVGSTDDILIPYKKHIFKLDKFDDLQIEFIMEKNKISGMKYMTPSGIFECEKIE